MDQGHNERRLDAYFDSIYDDLTITEPLTQSAVGVRMPFLRQSCTPLHVLVATLVALCVVAMQVDNVTNEYGYAAVLTINLVIVGFACIMLRFITNNSNGRQNYKKEEANDLPNESGDEPTSSQSPRRA